MKQSILLLAIAAALASCTSVPPVSGTIIAEQGEVRVQPDGRIEIVIQPASGK